MTEIEDFDVIVLGAGISGMMVASELSQNHSVLLLEKQPSIQIRKYWLTNRRSVELNPELNECIDSHYKHIDFIAYDMTAYRCHGDYYLWDTQKLINHLQEIIISNRGNIRTDCRFYSFTYSHNRIIAFVNNYKVSAKLIIDCMGYASPLINSKLVVDIIGYYIMYGATLKLAKEIAPVGLFNILLDARPKYVEIFPTKNGYANTVIISPERSIREPKALEEDFTFIVKCSQLKYYFNSDAEIRGILGGIIPIGYLRKTALKRIYFFGESNQLNPATTATGFTRMLYTYKKLAFKLSCLIEEEKLNRAELESIDIDYLSGFNRKFQLNVFHEVLKWNSDKFKSLVKQMMSMGDNVVYDIIFGDLTPSTYFTLNNILNLLKTKNTIVLKAFIKSLI